MSYGKKKAHKTAGPAHKLGTENLKYDPREGPRVQGVQERPGRGCDAGAKAQAKKVGSSQELTAFTAAQDWAAVFTFWAKATGAYQEAQERAWELD